MQVNKFGARLSIPTPVATLTFDNMYSVLHLDGDETVTTKCLLIATGADYRLLNVEGCETFEGRAQRLDYKTMRYPGHFELMRFFFDELGLRDQRELAGEILVNAKPPVDDDVVYLYAAVEGRVLGDGDLAAGQLARKQYVRAYQPLCINGRTWRAISWTTAASAVAVVELVASGQLPAAGFISQEDIPLEALLATRNGARFAELGQV